MVLRAIPSIALGVLSLLASPGSSAEAETLDGRLFDPGLTFEAPADGAPEALAQMSGFLGDWDIEQELTAPGQESLKSQGIARVTFMNRGHSIMERTRIEDFDGQGNPMATMAFLSVSTNGVWTVGEGNSWSETISIASGGFEGSNLVLHDAVRPRGGPVLLLQRRTYEPKGEDDFEMRVEISQDLGERWLPVAVRRYQRREPVADFFPVRNDTGQPAPDRPEEAAEFDFLIGEYDANHWMRTPQGVLAWPANATAVFALDGWGLLEFNSHNLDPTLPDAATSILRLYNRAMRRWESLFLSNRGNTPLHFGGVREDDRIVLHAFQAQTASNPFSQWIFHDVREDAYRWKGLTSRDRGRTYPIYWGIDFVRKGVTVTDENGLLPVSEVIAQGADGHQIFGDLYRPKAPGATTVVLFHQAGGDARGEYGEIAQRLQQEGYEVFAWDVRGGGDRFGSSNRTVDALEGPAPEGYCSAYPDLQAALEYAFLYGSGGPILTVGSSYSAALVVRLGVEQAHRLAGVAAFSPASGRMEECAVENFLPKLGEVPLLVFRPEGEMEVESVAAQKTLFDEHGVEVFVAPEAAHGASMLAPGRSKGDVEATWARFLAFLADPSGKTGSE